MSVRTLKFGVGSAARLPQILAHFQIKRLETLWQWAPYLPERGRGGGGVDPIQTAYSFLHLMHLSIEIPTPQTGDFSRFAILDLYFKMIIQNLLCVPTH